MPRYWCSKFKMSIFQEILNKLFEHAVKKEKMELQLFAGGEKTEKATPKKRQDARKKGQVLQSREITGAMVLIFLFIALKIFGGSMYNEISNFMRLAMTEYTKADNIFTIDLLRKIFTEMVIVILKMVAPIFAVAIITGLVAGYAQVGFLFTLEPIGMKFNRINPLSGFKRMFSMRSVIELLKSVLKIVVVSFVAYSYLKGEAPNIYNLMGMDPKNIAIYMCDIAINVAIRICVVLIILAIFDYGYQWWEFEKSLKMSKQEIKEEYKQMEGNPEIKAKIKQTQRQISMRRMLQDVPKADVVITNPTHFAVAIKYDPEKSAAPVVVAKGQDYLAQRIKEIAKENKVEIVENKPLARSLYDTVDIGGSIPPELYQAVAEVLAFVYGLKNKNVG